MEILLSQLQKQIDCMREEVEEMVSSQVVDGFQNLMKMIGINWYKKQKPVKMSSLNVEDENQESRGFSVQVRSNTWRIGT